MRILKDLVDLAQQLSEMRKQYKDYVVPVAGLDMNDEGKLTMFVDDEHKAMSLLSHAHSQLADRLGIAKRYYDRCLFEATDLLSTNVNYWFRKAPTNKKYLVRTINNSVRALLSTRYRIVDHLDLLTTAVQVITGQDKQKDTSHAVGAGCFTWNLDLLRMDVGFVNPSMVADLNHLDRGVHLGMKKENFGGTSGTAFVYPGAEHHHAGTIYTWGNKPKPPAGTHPVFPAAFVKNHEGGAGSINVSAGIYEAVCDNTCRIGVQSVQRHIGRPITMDDIASPDTLRKENELVFARFADVLRSVFDPTSFLNTCKKMRGLQDFDVDNAKQAAKQIVSHYGLDEGLREDILSAYSPLGGKGTALDLQRALTNAANDLREDYSDRAEALEVAAGSMLNETWATMHSMLNT